MLIEVKAFMEPLGKFLAAFLAFFFQLLRLTALNEASSLGMEFVFLFQDAFFAGLVRVFIELAYWLTLKYARTPDPLWGSRGDGHGDGGLSACLRLTSDAVLLLDSARSV